MHNSSRPGPKPRLSRDAVIDGAIACGDRTVTMQAVADQLQVAPSAIYRYFAGRDELVLAALGERLRRAPKPDRGAPWRDVLETEAALRWDILTSYSGLALSAPSTVEDIATPRLEALVSALVASGFSLDEASLAADTVLDLVDDGARQALQVGLGAEGSGEQSTETQLDAFPVMLRPAVARILRDPRAHVMRKVQLVLDGLAVLRSRHTSEND